jgi:hypothetical protein
MKESIKRLWEKHPLVIIVVSALLFRLIATIFSKGFGWHDDHFLVIEPSQSWVEGYDYNNWLPQNSGTDSAPEGPSLFYPGLHYLLFLYLKWRGLADPQYKMYVVRGLHALYSMITVVVGYKIAKHYAKENVAKLVGMLLALYWFMPMLSVRNLVEMVCIPPLMLATWFMIDPARKDKAKTYIWVGILCGLACNIRFQSAFSVAGMGLLILFSKNWKHLFFFVLSYVCTFIAFQGGIDMAIWGHPFAEFSRYIRYNVDNAYNYGSEGPWAKYFLLIGGMLVPPISLFLMFGYGRSWRKYPVLFLPSFIFFAFHCIFPNKQERFILPIIPFVIVLGCIGWAEFVDSSKYWGKHKKLLKGCWTFFWVLNIIALPVVSTMYTKRNRVESMSYLSHQKDLHGLMIEETIHDDYVQPAHFYIGRFDVHIVGVTAKHSLYRAYMEYKDDPRPSIHPNYVVFFGKDDIEKRVAYFKKMFPNTEYKATICPSFIDDLVEFLNPINRNETTYIYKFDDSSVQIPKDTAAAALGH